MKKTFIIGSIIGLSLVCLLVIFLALYSPKKVFERKFGFALPQVATVVNCNYSLLDDRLRCKIVFKNEDFPEIEKGLREYYEKHRSLSENNAWPVLPNFSNTTSWWDLNEDDVQLSFFAMLGGESISVFASRPMTVYSFAFLTQLDDGQCALYISC